MIVVWTDDARFALADIYDYISQRNPDAAERIIARLLERGDQVAAFPESGRMVPEYEVPRVRELIEGNYRIIYRIVDDETLEVLTVLHGRKPLESDP